MTGIEIAGGIVVMGFLVKFGFHKALGNAIENHPVLGPKSNRRALTPPDRGPHKERNTMYHHAIDEEALAEMLDRWKLEEARADPRSPDNDLMPTDVVAWKRIKRPIYSKWWRFVHNLIAHPLMAIYRPVGEPFHDWTAQQMYKDNGSEPVVTDND